MFGAKASGSGFTEVIYGHHGKGDDGHSYQNFHGNDFEEIPT